jgi:hypothetical protein
LLVGYDRVLSTRTYVQPIPENRARAKANGKPHQVLIIYIFHHLHHFSFSSFWFVCNVRFFRPDMFAERFLAPDRLDLVTGYAYASFQQSPYDYIPQ